MLDTTTQRRVGCLIVKRMKYLPTANFRAGGKAKSPCLNDDAYSAFLEVRFCSFEVAMLRLFGITMLSASTLMADQGLVLRKRHPGSIPVHGRTLGKVPRVQIASALRAFEHAINRVRAMLRLEL